MGLAGFNRRRRAEVERIEREEFLAEKKRLQEEESKQEDLKQKQKPPKKGKGAN